MLKNPIPELVLYFDLEWVPDAAGAKRLFDLPEETTEFEAMQRLWEHAPKYDAETNPRPFCPGRAKPAELANQNAWRP